MDQAQSLRRLAAAQKVSGAVSPPLRTMAITSGKGGVGKTNLTVNLAIELARLGSKVLVIDADLGLANVDVVLGLTPKYNLNDVIHGEKSINEVVVQGPGGIKILPAASGVTEMTTLTTEEKMVMLQELDSFQTDADTVLIDTAAGISDTVLYFNIAAQDRLVIATGEPTSLTDAYALIKVLHTEHQETRFKLLVNNVEDAREAKGVYSKLAMAADHFLGGLAIEYMGFVPRDKAMTQSVMNQKPLMLGFPQSPAAKAIRALAQRFNSLPPAEGGGNIKFFWRRLVNMS